MTAKKVRRILVSSACFRSAHSLQLLSRSSELESFVLGPTRRSSLPCFCSSCVSFVSPLRSRDGRWQSLRLCSAGGPPAEAQCFHLLLQLVA